MSNFANGIGDPVESKIIDVMRKKDYSLDTVNNYGDNLLHMSAANGCYTVIKEILMNHDSRDVNLQNDCGWTPLMQAIRNGNFETVKLLLASGCYPEQSKFQGISVIALAVAMGREMFEIVYEACPSALQNSKNYNISPLCVAAMKNDKELFFRLLELGIKISEAGDYTLLMMAQSNVPEIAKLGDTNLDASSYWLEEDFSTDNSESFFDEDFEVPQMSSTLRGTENYSMEHNDNGTNDDSKIPKICIIPPKDTRKMFGRRNSMPRMINCDDKFASKSLISPRLEYTRDGTLAMSPNFCFARRETSNDEEFSVKHNVKRDKLNEKLNDDDIVSSKNTVISDRVNRVYKYQLKRPPNLQISRNNALKESIEKIDDIPISPNKTPVESRYKTPPREMALDIHQKKMAFILKRFGLVHFIPIFLEQEVDLDLFLSLNEQDLLEIGIEKKSDRIILKSVIDECNRNQFFV